MPFAVRDGTSVTLMHGTFVYGRRYAVGAEITREFSVFNLRLAKDQSNDKVDVKG
jgi:hypothetical protein